MRETIARVLRSYGLTQRGEGAAASALVPDPADQNITDADFDDVAWERCGRLAAAPRRIVLRHLPSDNAPSANIAGDAIRAVIEPPREAEATELQELHERGVRALRFVLDARTNRDIILRWAERVVPFGWHIEIKLPDDNGARRLADDEWVLLQLPVPTCFTGLAGFLAGREANDAETAFLVELVAMGRFWLKLCGAETARTDAPVRDALHRLVKAAMTVRDDRLVWGSGPANGPAQTDLNNAISTLHQLVPEAAGRSRVLWSNPAALYHF